MLREFYSQLNNRESAILIWIFLAASALLFSKNIRDSLLRIIRILLTKRFLVLAFIILLYFYPISSFLKRIDFFYIKDFLFWFITVAFSLIGKSVKAKNGLFFTELVVNSFKITVFLEFIMNLHSFNLWIELITFPILSLLVILQGSPDINSEHEKLRTLIGKVLNTVGLVYFILSLFFTITHFFELTTLATLKSFFFPVILTILFIPILYFIAIYTTYETFFVRLSLYQVDEIKKNCVRKSFLKRCHINLSKLKQEVKEFDNFVLFNEEAYNNYSNKNKCSKR